MAEDIKIYSTRDLYFAGVLVTKGHKLIKVDYQVEGIRHNPVGYFGFEDTTELRDLEKEYWAGHVTVEPQEYMQGIRLLKSTVVNQYKQPSANFDAINK